MTPIPAVVVATHRLINQYHVIVRIGAAHYRGSFTTLSFSGYLVRRISKEINIGKRVRPTIDPASNRTVSRTTSYNMVLFLLSVVVATIVVAIPRIRNRIASGAWTRSGIVRGDFSIARECAQQSMVAGPTNQFLVVVLPDGTIVTPRVAGQV
jgi:hypothetical protein